MSAASPPLLVAAVGLIDGAGRVLMQQRCFNDVHGGLWEFPGGKLEHQETFEAGAVRELAEELSVAIEPGDLVMVGSVRGQTADGLALVLRLYACRRWRGEPSCRVAQALAWIAPDALASLAMSPLDVPLAEVLRTLL